MPPNGSGFPEQSKHFSVDWYVVCEKPKRKAVGTDSDPFVTLFGRLRLIYFWTNNVPIDREVFSLFRKARSSTRQRRTFELSTVCRVSQKARGKVNADISH